MQRTRLKLVPSPPAPVRARPVAVGALGALGLGAALLATMLGADASRAPSTPRSTAERAVLAGLEGGPRAAAPSLYALRDRLGRRPFDAETRAVYAAALADLASGSTGRHAAAFHARRAASLAPVTAPVTAMTARALLVTGHPHEAASIVRAMFAWAPRAASDLLLELERYAGPDAVAVGLPEDPVAHLARARALKRAGRAAEARELIDDALARWPDDQAIREAAAADALGRGDVAALRRIVPPDMPLVEEAPSAQLLTYRARSRASAGDSDGARSDALRAIALAEGRRAVLSTAAGTLESLGDVDAARSAWVRVLFGLPEDEGTRRERARVLAALARLEERAGRSGEALRYWRETLTNAPDDAEAHRRIDALTGGR